MLMKVALKELLEFSRDPCILGITGAYIFILAFSCIALNMAYSRQFKSQSNLQIQAREAWLTQESISPHQATHHGTTVYKLPSPLSSFDPGVAPEFGTAVRIESHKRHEATFTTEEDKLSLLQLDLTTPALLMQAVFPLVLIVLSHSIVSREHELGTGRLFLSLGISKRMVILGKLTSLFIVIGFLSIPLVVAFLWTITCNSTEAGMPLLDVIGRTALVNVFTLIYLGGWCAAGTTLSTRCTSGTSLIILLSCWAIWTLVIPRVAVDLANSRYPVPSQKSLMEARELAIRNGSFGKTSLEDYNLALEKKLLKEYKVTDLKDLPINLDAAHLLAMEEFTNAIDDHSQSQIQELYQKQYNYLDWFEFVSPYLAIRAVSSSLAGTDRHHHAAFIESTEKYRRLLVETMNTAEMKGERPDLTTESANSFWSKVPEFEHQFPPVAKVLNAMRWPIGMLVLWFSAMLTFAMLPPKGMSA